MSKAYSSNLSPEQFGLLKDLIPAAKSGSRPRSVDVWEILNANFYVLVSGCQWRGLPGDFLPWQTVYSYVYIFNMAIRVDAILSIYPNWDSCKIFPFRRSIGYKASANLYEKRGVLDGTI